jgi:two-component system chemotaxis response regulator CheB
MSLENTKSDHPVTNVMLVDDSVVVRGILREIITRDPRYVIVATCSDGQQGVDGYKRHKPDVVILDIEMPEKDGLTALKEILEFDRDARVIMCSSLTVSGAESTIEALRIGAADCLAKPTSKTVERSDAFEERLMRALNAFAKTSTTTRALYNAAHPQTPFVNKALDDENITLTPYPITFPNSFPLALAIGSSTGGPKALIDVIGGLNKKMSLPIFITQHIPEGFSKFLASNIQKNTGFPTHEAENDMVIEAGHIYLAPGGIHMGIKPGAPKRIVLLDTPPENFCKPSVDVMVRSIAAAYGNGILTVILTGMGADGKKSVEALGQASPTNIILAQDKPTSIVWGMPGAAAQTGKCHAVLPLDKIPGAINKLVQRLIP